MKPGRRQRLAAPAEQETASVSCSPRQTWLCSGGPTRGVVIAFAALTPEKLKEHAAELWGHHFHPRRSSLRACWEEKGVFARCLVDD